jgi:hypothetical protein
MTRSNNKSGCLALKVQRSTFSIPLFSRNGPAVHYVKTNACILKQNSKPNWTFENYNLIYLLLIRYLRIVFSRKEGIHWYFFVLFYQMCTTLLIYAFQIMHWSFYLYNQYTLFISYNTWKDQINPCGLLKVSHPTIKLAKISCLFQV